jgi:hypothetical protein
LLAPLGSASWPNIWVERSRSGAGVLIEVAAVLEDL